MKSNKKNLLIVEDDPGLQTQLRWHFDQYEIIQATDRQDALDQMRMHEPEVVLQDLGLPPDADGVTEGLLTVQELMKIAPHTKIIVITGNGDQENAIKAIGLGAYDFYSKPIDTDTLDLIVQRAYLIYKLEAQNRQLKSQKHDSPLEGIIASDKQMLSLCRTIEKVAPTMATALLEGESGTGKERFARAIHSLSPRKKKRFVAINCAAIPDSLIESELFGYERGAFTGATKQTPGKVEIANSGSLFLDEIGDMPLSLQAKLLRFLQERVIERLGGRNEIPVDVRVVCATNKNLSSMVADGSFREDLYYRISEITIEIPPLRDRGSDKVLIARHFLKQMAEEQKKSITGFTHETIQAIESYHWPGNVREMENKIRRALIMCESKHISANDMDLLSSSTEISLNLRHVRQEAERNAISSALSMTDNNISAAAKLLGVTRPTLYDLLKKYQIHVT